MTRIRVGTVIDAPPRVVWADVRNLGSHVDWMEDAVAIDFTTAAREGVGTTFRCRTRIGPIVVTDHMTVTEWDEGHCIGIVHRGIVTGTGRFTLRRARGGATKFTWNERLRFPWWMGGPVGGAVGGRVLKRIWRRNLANLAKRFG